MYFANYLDYVFARQSISIGIYLSFGNWFLKRKKESNRLVYHRKKQQQPNISIYIDQSYKKLKRKKSWNKISNKPTRKKVKKILANKSCLFVCLFELTDVDYFEIKNWKFQYGKILILNIVNTHTVVVIHILTEMGNL